MRNLKLKLTAIAFVGSILVAAASAVRFDVLCTTSPGRMEVIQQFSVVSYLLVFCLINLDCNWV
jgi:hypothetical protein